MNNSTKSLLDLYDENIDELDLSNKNINGVLDLSKFKKLKKLNCSHNQITKIINSSIDLDLDCSYNNIKFVSWKKDFSNKNLLINITTNPIKIIDYPFEKNNNIFPNTLKKITFGEKFNDQVNNLPIGLEIIVFGTSFNQPIDNLPCTIKEIYFGESFNQSVDYLPNSLEIILFGVNFNQSIDNLPSGLTQIKFDTFTNGLESKFNQNINCLPNNIEKLILPNNFDSKIFNYPTNIKYLYLGKKFSQPLDNIPDSIEILIFDSRYQQELKKFPANLKHLTISSKMSNYSNLLEKIPSSLISLYLPDSSINLLNKKLLTNLKRIKICKFTYYNDIFTDIIKNSNLEEIIIGTYETKLDTILSNLPSTIQKLTILNNIRENIRIKTNLIPTSLIFFQINGKKYEENKLKKIKQEDIFIFN
jgi:hypothetical protein